MLTASRFTDLLKVVADAPDPRFGMLASVILARDCVVRLEATGRDYDSLRRSGLVKVSECRPYEIIASTAAVNVQAVLDAVASVDTSDDAAVRFQAPYGPAAASNFFAWGLSSVPSFGAGSIGATAPGSAISDPRNTGDADVVIAAVRAAVACNFDSTRFGLFGPAPPSGGAFGLGRVHVPVTAFTITLPNAGTWRVMVSADVTSRSTANPETLTIQHAINGGTVVTHSLTRTTDSDPPFPAVRRQDVPVHFETSDDIAVGGPPTLTIRTPTSFEEAASGVVRFWQVA